MGHGPPVPSLNTEDTAGGGGEQEGEGYRKSREGREGEDTTTDNRLGGWTQLVLLQQVRQTLRAPPSSYSFFHCWAVWVRTMGMESFSPPAWQDWAHFLLAHRKECFLVLAVWDPQGRIVVGAPKG